MALEVLFVGDTHGDLEFIARVCEFAADHDVNNLIQCGDWGYLWPNHRDHVMFGSKADELSVILKHYDQTMRFLCGNHDWHPKLMELTGGKRVATEIAERVIYQPRGSVHQDTDGTRFLFMGGAASIDKAHRTEGKSWWPEETITKEDMVVALAQENIDVLVTHDAPDYPPGFRPAGTPEFRQLSTQSMNDVRTLITHFSPKLHVHGHWHTRATTRIDSTKVEALASNINRFHDSLLLWKKS